MKITQDVRDYAEENGLMETAAIEEGMQEKAREFANAGSEIYL
jgi:phosphomethylpyrimidine synthase